MENTSFRESELILNPDGSVYHLKLLPEQLADTIILVGDPGRVKNVSAHFDTVDVMVENREFITHTGMIGNRRVSCVSTGIGCDNVDIVLNELDALANIDFTTRNGKKAHKSLRIVRIGTTGSLQPDLEVDTWVASAGVFGLDGLMNYYRHDKTEEMQTLVSSFMSQTQYPGTLARPYYFPATEELLSLFRPECTEGITLTAPGFYAPQGRVLRYDLEFTDLMDRMSKFDHNGRKITNFEMETSGIYGLGTLLGHRVCSVCAVVANRQKRTFSTDPYKTVEALIKFVLDRVTSRS